MNWLMIAGLGLLWLGTQIVWVAPVPTQLRPAAADKPEPGSAAAFNVFWLDQYAWIGITLCVAGSLLLLVGWLS